MQLKVRNVTILLGGNLGDRFLNVELATQYIQKDVGQIISSSSIYQTKAWGYEDQPDFLNQVLIVSTDVSPETIMNTLLCIEQKMGRIRDQKWHERIIDLDVLFMDDLIMNTELLTIPHPHIATRRFVLEPLSEIMPSFIHPVLGVSVAQLLKDCTDSLEVERVYE